MELAVACPELLAIRIARPSPGRSQQHQKSPLDVFSNHLPLMHVRSLQNGTQNKKAFLNAEMTGYRELVHGSRLFFHCPLPSSEHPWKG